MRKFRLFASLVLILSISLNLCSCQKDKDRLSCLSVVCSLTNAEVRLPAGKIYHSKANHGEDAFISEHLLSALYGNGKMPEVCDGWIEYSFFLSHLHPCEFAVIYCNSHNNATDTAKLLCKRISSIKSAKADSEGILQNARVIILHNYVLLIISSDTESAIKIVKSLIC